MADYVSPDQPEQLFRSRPDLDRFVHAQQDVYPVALAEIRAGRKRTHWMWYIFPQLAGLGFSSMAVRYALSDRQEAIDYLAHPLLRSRLIEISAALLTHDALTAFDILGTPDDLKLHSSSTLFAAISAPGSVFEWVLGRYFDGLPDPGTLGRLD